MLGESQDWGNPGHPCACWETPRIGGRVLATLCMLGESDYLEGLLRMRGHHMSAASAWQVHLSPIEKDGLSPLVNLLTFMNVGLV